jgi:hypothetical protein
MNKAWRHVARAGCYCVALLLSGKPALAEIDLTGVWFVAYHEDWIEVGTGPDIADYTGLPISDAARERGLSWNPSLINQPERQCAQLPLDYTVFWTNFRIWKDVDPFTQELVAWKSQRQWGEEKQPLWMDRRSHPPSYAPHAYQGFSTREWEGNKLKITTTHLKEAYSRRNGVPRSDRATIVVYYIRHDDHLTVARIVQDPDYLTEPLIHTTNYVKNLHYNIPPWKCEIVTELTGKKEGFVPHYFPWKNPYVDEFAEKYHMSKEAALGGAETMYPSYIEQEKDR